MNYQDWAKTVPPEIREDPLWSVEAYRLGLFAGDLAWHDVQRIRAQRFFKLADQLLSSVGGVSAQTGEGYSRGTGKDRARFYEYALGSAREGRDWYFKARHILGGDVARHRIRLLTRITRLLLKMVPSQRSYTVHDPGAAYCGADSRAPLDILENVPMGDAPLSTDSRITHHESRITHPE
jgi:four helix bundle protein